MAKENELELLKAEMAALKEERDRLALEKMELEETTKKQGLKLSSVPSGDKFRVTVRHSPCPVKSAVVDAKSEQEAYDKFMDLNQMKANDLVAKNPKNPIGKDMRDWRTATANHDVLISPVTT